jgi:NAD(P) transhydrogenase
MDSKNESEFEVVVIGTGPGGEGAAMHLAKNGRRVAVVERFRQIGGGSTHWGTIPSKSLRQAIFQLAEANKNPIFRASGANFQLSFAQLRKAANSIIDRQVEVHKTYYERNGIPIITGQARFVDANTVEAEQADGAKHRLRAKSFIIAVGARPYHPPDVDFTHARIFDSDKILSLEQTPLSVTIYGAGVVGCEYTSMFRNLNVKVNLINTRSKLLEFLDDEIIDALSYHMRDQGVLLRHNEEYAGVDARSDGVVLNLKSGKQIKTDILLWANGRTGNTDDLGLDKIGLKPDSRGQLKVNEDYQTELPHIYAVGDVIGFPALASAAFVQGRYAARHIIEGYVKDPLARVIPAGIYTSPEISSVGKTERELTEEKTPYEIGHAAFKNLARAQITGQTVGMLKLLFHRETLEILGVHCFGANASEIVHIGQAIMAQTGKANSLLYFINTTFNYPTMAEAYRVAALNGYNRLF